jgi:threonine synthase
LNWFLQCTECGRQFPLEPGRYLCDDCSTKQEQDRPLRGILECRWEEEPGLAGNPPRWEAYLPVRADSFPPMPVGNTPLWEVPRLRKLAGLPRLYIKDDTCEPSGSFKDRASFLVAAFARQWGIREIALASTGNAASSMAAVGAASSINIRVFLPKKAPIAKRIQVLQYGAALSEVEGTYDLAFEQSLAYSRETGVLSRNTAYNPLTIEGKKTVSFEIAAQLAEQGRTADHIFVPVGDGVILAGLYKGFEDLLRLGFLTRIPTIWACQAEGSSAISRSFFRLRKPGLQQRSDGDPQERAQRTQTSHGQGKYPEKDSGGRATQGGGAGSGGGATHGGGAAYGKVQDKPFYKTPAEVFAQDIFSQPEASDTIADSISVDVPRNGYHALGKLYAYGGWPVTVTDREILLAQRELASHSGLFAEPSSSTAWAAVRKVLQEQENRSATLAGAPVIHREDTVVILITGTGLKDTSAAQKALELPQ